MALIFVANVSKQRHIFCYHAKGDHEKGKLLEFTIERGHQIKIEDTQAVLDKVIERYRRYGLIEVREVGTVKRFSGLIFQAEKPIDIDKLKEAVERQHNAEDERANEMRVVGVLGDQERAKQVAKEVGLPEIKVTSEVEERQSNDGANQTARPIRQKLSVAEDGIRRRANA
jgi:hypothetical protein